MVAAAAAAAVAAAPTAAAALYPRLSGGTQKMEMFENTKLLGKRKVAKNSENNNAIYPGRKTPL